MTENLWRPIWKRGTLWFGKIPPAIQEQRRTVLKAIPLDQMLKHLVQVISLDNALLVPVIRSYENLDRRDGSRQDILELFVGPSLVLRDRLQAMQTELLTSPHRVVRAKC